MVIKPLINRTKNNFNLILSTLSLLVISCVPNSTKQQKDKIVVRISHAPDGINPVFSTSSMSMYICDNLYQKLINYDYSSGKIVPILADSLPLVNQLDSTLKITYKLRTEALWNKKNKVSANDVVFSFKIFTLLRHSEETLNSLAEQIKDINIHKENPNIISLLTSKSIRHLNFAGSDIVILPEFQLDPKHLLRQYSFKEFKSKADSLRKTPTYQHFIASIRKKKWMVDGGIIGSGPYEIINWSPNKGIVLEKKENWWGDKLKDNNIFFLANAPKIEFRIVKEESAAITQLKNKEIDAMFYINPEEFEVLKNSNSFNNDYYLFNPNLQVFSFIGINTQNPLLKDKFTRKALACIVNTDYIINNLRMGHAQKINGPVPLNKYSNPRVKGYPFNPVMAKEFIARAGWKDSNKNGVLDKMIDGELKEFEIDYKFSSSSMRKAVGEMLKQEGEKLGIIINLKELKFQEFVRDLKAHKFDICYDAVSTDLSPVNAFDMYHTSSINGGNNHVFFGNDESDRVIEEMDKTIDPDKFKALYFKLQEILHDEAAHIFLICTKNPLAIRKGMGTIPTFSNYPGFWIAALNPQKKY